MWTYPEDEYAGESERLYASRDCILECREFKAGEDSWDYSLYLFERECESAYGTVQSCSLRGDFAYRVELLKLCEERTGDALDDLCASLSIPEIRPL